MSNNADILHSGELISGLSTNQGSLMRMKQAINVRSKEEPFGMGSAVGTGELLTAGPSGASNEFNYQNTFDLVSDPRVMSSQKDLRDALSRSREVLAWADSKQKMSRVALNPFAGQSSKAQAKKSRSRSRSGTR